MVPIVSDRERSAVGVDGRTLTNVSGDRPDPRTSERILAREDPGDHQRLRDTASRRQQSMCHAKARV